MLLVLALFLSAFEGMNKSELSFARRTRDSMMAFYIAEAGAQEGSARLTMFGGIPGTTCFVNSMTSGAACSGSTSNPNPNTVVYQAPLASDSAIFPIMALGNSGGTPRVVRVLQRAMFQAGFGSMIVGPQITFQGDASWITGDAYSNTSIVFNSRAKSPQPGAGAGATTLTGPQALAGTTITTQAGGQWEPGPYTTECASGSLTEVAPTACARATDGRNNPLPVNWHPMVPIGMSSADFTTLMNNCFTFSPRCPSFIATRQATQNGVGVTYMPMSYLPSYWSRPGAYGKVLLATAGQPFCVNASANTVTAPPCGASAHYYGQLGLTTRFLDWGLVQDDLTRGAAQTFFQAGSCAVACADAGNQNGVRYIPLLPSLWVSSAPALPTFGQIACRQNVDPGFSVFDRANSNDGVSCAPPVQTIAATTLTFSGTRRNPEALVIDNAGFGTVHVTGSIPGNSAVACGSTNFDDYNWGIILATGDVDIAANTVFTGYIYTLGSVYSHGTVLVRGGIFSSNSPSSGSAVTQLDDSGTFSFCGGTSTQMPLSPEFHVFSWVSWQDRPLGEP